MPFILFGTSILNVSFCSFVYMYGEHMYVLVWVYTCVGMDVSTHVCICACACVLSWDICTLCEGLVL